MNAAPPLPVVPPPQTTRETILARLEGIHNLYREGVSSAAMWGYCATGNLITPWNEYRTGIVRKEWDASQAVFHAAHPFGMERDECLHECERLLELWLKRISPDVGTDSIGHTRDVISIATDQVNKL